MKALKPESGKGRFQPGNPFLHWVFTFPLLLLAPNMACTQGWTASPTDGLRWRSDDGDFAFHAGGVFAGDLVLHESNNTHDTGLRVGIAEPILVGSYRETWRFYIATDLEGTRTADNLYEAYAAWTGVSWLRLSTGLQQLPLGFEASTRPEDLWLVRHSFSYFMDYGTDWAVRAEGELGEGIFEWDTAYAFGHGFDANGQRQGGPQAAARAFVRPLRRLGGPEASFFKSLAARFFVGGGYANTWDWEGGLRVRNPGGTRLFDTMRFEADHSHFLTWVVGFEVGPVRLYLENTTGGYYGAETPVGKRDLDNQTTSWQATLSWLINGGAYDGRLFHAPQAQPPGPNVWEIAVRYANADIDRDFYHFGLTDYSTSSQEFRSLTAALNWYATQNLRVSLMFVRTLADDDIASLGFQGRDNAGLIRVQHRF